MLFAFLDTLTESSIGNGACRTRPNTALPAMTQSQPLFVHFLIASETLTIPCINYFSFQILGPHAVTSAL